MWNTMKTTILLAGLTGLLVLVGSALGGTGGMVIAFVLAGALNLGAWWFSDSIALKFSGAKPVSPEEQPELHAIVDRLSARAAIPRPRVYVIDSPMPNAFATGRDPQHGAVAVTTGLMGLMNRDELAGVVAHELAHIRHRDTLISSVVATIAGAIGMIADMAMWAALFGGFGGGDDEEEGGGVVGGLFMIFLAPIMAMLIQLAISRSREFTADEGGARILGNPLPLASALEKLEAHTIRLFQSPPRNVRGTPAPQPEPAPVRPATAHMYIVNPLAGGGMIGLFRTHPVTEERVRRLRAMAASPIEMSVA
jgi:heat shock protein HtpX